MLLQHSWSSRPPDCRGLHIVSFDLRALQRIKRPAEAGRLFLIFCRRACRLGRDSVSVGRVFDLGFDPVGRAFGLDFDSADRAWADSGLSSCFLSSWGTEDNDGKLCSFQKNAQPMELFWMYPTAPSTVA